MSKTLTSLPLVRLRRMLKATAELAGADSDSARIIRRAIEAKKRERKSP